MASNMRRTCLLRPSWRASAARFGRVEHRDLVRARGAVVELDPAGEPLHVGRRQRGLGLDGVELLDLVARVHQAVGELAVVGQQQHAGRVAVEPPDGHHAPLAELAVEQVHHRAALLRVVGGGDRVARLVQHDVREGLRVDRAAVDLTWSCPTVTFMPSSSAGLPLTWTRPAAIHSSAVRRLHSPACAM
jgi:hypothetical protein